MTHSQPLKQISKQCSQLLLLCVQQEEMFVPYPLHTLRNQAGNVCHSKPFPIPGSKSEIQQISVRRWEWVTLVLCVSLISTWKYTAKNGNIKIKKLIWSYISNKLKRLESIKPKAYFFFICTLYAYCRMHSFSKYTPFDSMHECRRSTHAL